MIVELFLAISFHEISRDCWVNGKSLGLWITDSTVANFSLSNGRAVCTLFGESVLAFFGVVFHAND